MGYLKMGIWLCITVWFISLIDRKKNRIVPICAIYFLITVINDIFFCSVLELANAFGISYQMGDLMLMLFASTLVIDIVRKQKIKRNISNMLISGIFLLMMIGTVIGVLTFGISSEWLGDVRSLFGVIFPIMWFIRFFRIEYLKLHIRIIEKVMRIIVIVTIVLWALDLGIGLHPLQSQYNATLSDGGSTMRFVQPYEVFCIAIYALYLTRKGIREKGLISIKALLFLGIVMLFQHRSIWMALALGVIWIIVAESKNKKHSMKLIGQVLILICCGVAFLRFSNGDLVKNITHSWEVLLQLLTGQNIKNSTASTRTQVWDAVLSDLNGISALIGRPFGYGYAHSIGWTTSPHSGYIRLIGRIGYVGIGLFALLLILSFLNSCKKTPYIPEFILCVAGFMYGYDATWSCGVVIGASIAYIAHKKNWKL